MRIAWVDPSFATRLHVARLLEARGHEVVPFSDEHEALSQVAADPGIEALHWMLGFTPMALAIATGLALWPRPPQRTAESRT